MASINPYLAFAGNCEEAFTYYKSVFGGEFSIVRRFGEMPPREGVELSEEYKQKIMHVSLPIGDDQVLMGSDQGGEWGQDTVFGNNVTLSIRVDSREQADKLFAGLSEGGNVSMPMSEAFWGSYFGMCTDKYEVQWMINFGGLPDK